MATVEGLSRPISDKQVIARASLRLLPGWELVTDLGIAKRSGRRAHARSRNGSLPASSGTGAGWQAPIISIHVWLVCLANSATNSDGVLGLARVLQPRASRAPSNCGAIATLSRFLDSATLRGGLL